VDESNIDVSILLDFEEFVDTSDSVLRVFGLLTSSVGTGRAGAQRFFLSRFDAFNNGFMSSLKRLIIKLIF